MRASTAILVLLLATGSAAAQESPDYTRNRLLHLFAEAAEQESENPVRYRRGAIEFTALGTSWKLNYLPMMALSGSGFGSTAVTQELPDPFLLTGTQIAMAPRHWRTRRNVSSELRRIEKLERAKIRVTVD